MFEFMDNVIFTLHSVPPSPSVALPHMVMLSSHQVQVRVLAKMVQHVRTMLNIQMRIVTLVVVL